MLGLIHRRLERELREQRGCPVRVVYGPLEPAVLANPGDLIVLQHPDGPSDDVGAPRALGGNPRRRFSRAIACEFHVYAKATVDGATRRDHEDRAQKLVNQVLAALDDVLRGGEEETDEDGEIVHIDGTSYQWSQGRGGFDRGPGGVANSAHYVQAFTVHEPGTDAPFDGAPLDEFTLAGGSIASRTNVYGSTGEGAGETSCGGD